MAGIAPSFANRWLRQNRHTFPKVAVGRADTTFVVPLLAFTVSGLKLCTALLAANGQRRQSSEQCREGIENGLVDRKQWLAIETINVAFPGAQSGAGFPAARTAFFICGGVKRGEGQPESAEKREQHAHWLRDGLGGRGSDSTELAEVRRAAADVSPKWAFQKA